MLAAVVEAEQLEPGEERLLEALEPGAERTGTTPEKLLERLRARAASTACARTWPTGWRSSCSSREAKPISVEQAKARQKLWTPGKEEAAEGAGQLWTPGS